MPNPTETLRDWKDWRLWVAEDGYAFFQTEASFEWFKRKHFAELIGSGQYLPGRGATAACVGPEFDAVVLDIFRREARDQLARAAAQGA